MRKKAREMKWALRMFCGKYRVLYPLYFRLFEKKWFNRIHQPNPDIVIEGFGGSANSFAVYAFEAAQPKKLKIAHHLHITAQIKDAAKRGVPVFLIIRNPVDAVTSLLSRDYYPSARQGFVDYFKFYKDILPYKENLLIAPFEVLTSDIASLISQVNEKYGTTYATTLNMAEKGLKCLKTEGRSDVSAMPLRGREGLKKEAGRKVA